MESHALRIDLVSQIRINSILANHQLVVVGIVTGRPSDIHTTGTAVGSHQVIRNRTLGGRLQLDTIQHDTSTEVVGALKSNLIGSTHFRQGQLDTLSI